MSLGRVGRLQKTDLGVSGADRMKERRRRRVGRQQLGQVTASDRMTLDFGGHTDSGALVPRQTTSDEEEES